MPLLNWRLSAAVQLSDPGGGVCSERLLSKEHAALNKSQLLCPVDPTLPSKTTHAVRTAKHNEPPVFCQGLTTCCNPHTHPPPHSMSALTILHGSPATPPTAAALTRSPLQLPVPPLHAMLRLCFVRHETKKRQRKRIGHVQTTDQSASEQAGHLIFSFIYLSSGNLPDDETWTELGFSTSGGPAQPGRATNWSLGH